MKMDLALRSIALAALLATASAHAQGVIQFDWHGDQNLFQASFQVYDYQMVPGSNFEGPDWSSGKYQDALFDRTATITAPDAYFAPGTCYGTGGTPMHNGLDLNGNLMLGFGAPNPWNGIGFAATATEDSMGEMWQSGTLRETGHWTWAPIPEPTAFALFGLGLLALYMKKAASR